MFASFVTEGKVSTSAKIAQVPSRRLFKMIFTLLRDGPAFKLSSEKKIQILLPQTWSHNTLTISYKVIFGLQLCAVYERDLRDNGPLLLLYHHTEVQFRLACSTMKSNLIKSKGNTDKYHLHASTVIKYHLLQQITPRLDGHCSR